MAPKNRPPTHPGEMLLREFIEPGGVTQTAFAGTIGVSFVRLNDLIHARRRVTVDTALRLEQGTGCSAQTWLALQAEWDIWWARQGTS